MDFTYDNLGHTISHWIQKIWRDKSRGKKTTNKKRLKDVAFNRNLIAFKVYMPLNF